MKFLYENAFSILSIFQHDNCKIPISFPGVFSGLKGIVQKESFFGLYKGNGAQMVRIFPYGAVQFASFEVYKTVSMD